jgi:hypothetical protein
VARPTNRFIAFAIAGILVVALCLLFPRALAFAELAARQLRYFWWLVLIAAVGVYLAFFAGKKKN